MALTLTSLPHKLHRWLRIERRTGPRTRPVTLSRQRIFILPTRYGLLFAVLAFALLTGATNYNNSAGFLLSFLLIAIALVSMLHTYRNLARLTIRPGRAEPVFCGEAARFGILIDNPGGPARRAVALRLEDGDPHLLDVAAGETTAVSLTAPTLRRGRRPMGVLTVFSRYPLGLFHAWSHITLETSCLVYPRPARQYTPARGGRDRGGARQGRTPGNDDFLGHRDYHHGDSPRHVDWKAAARGKKLLTKVFAEHEDEELWLDWESQAGMAAEARLSRLCRGVLWAETSGRRYGLRLPGVTIPIGRGSDHKHRCLRALALYEPAA